MLHYDPMTANERAYLEGNGMLERALPLQHAAARPSPVASGAPAATQQQQTPAPLVVRRPKPPNAMPPPVVVPTTLVESIAAALGLTKEKLIQGVVRMAIAIGLTLMLFAGVSRALAETPVPHEVPAPAEAAYAAEPNVVTTSPSAVAAASVPHPARAKASQPKTGDKANPPVRRVQVDTKPPAPKPSTGARPEAKSQAAESTHSEAAEIVKQVFWNQFHAGPPAAPATAGPHAEGVDGKVNDFQSRKAAPTQGRITAADDHGAYASVLDALGKPGVAVALTAMFFLLMQSRQMKRIGTGAKLVTPKRAEAPPHAAPPASPLTPVTAVRPVATVPPVPVACFPPMLLAGAAAHQGHVRQRMEDRVRLVHTADLVAAVVCDGVGGMPLGADAAEAATQAACEYLQKHARADIRCVEAVFTAAASGVQMAAAAKGVSDGDGLRTTLLVAIASGTSVAWGYAGDGAIVLVRGDDGATCELLIEQHDASGALTASLGPAGLRGRPRFGTNAFEPGDAVVLGTDGCMDRCVSRAQFVEWLLAMAQSQRAGTNLSAGLASALAEFVAAKDANNVYIADDNATCAVLMRDSAMVQPPALGWLQTAPVGVA